MAEHHHAFFAGHQITVRRLPVGPAEERLPGFFVHEVAPGPRYAGWTYLSVGAWTAAHTQDGHGLEFVVCANQPGPPLVELVTMTAPWLPGSVCDHLLVSLPYAFGPELEIYSWPGGHAQILELLPITESERDYKIEHGQEALEQRLEGTAAHTANPSRQPVV